MLSYLAAWKAQAATLAYMNMMNQNFTGFRPLDREDAEKAPGDLPERVCIYSV
jgi:hypothetical protein